MVYRQALLTKDWKKELDALTEKTGVTLEDVCGYLGLSYSGDIRFYSKVPRKKSMFIGIGMAYGLGLEEINRWIVKYGDKRKLYVKDVPEDLIWTYLINTNHKDRSGTVNYYRLFDAAHDKAIETYNEVWGEISGKASGTVTMDRELAGVEYDEGFENLRGFVIEHMDGFGTAYSKSRKLLASYLDAIIKSCLENEASGISSVNSMRGYLDDSMINYLSGDPESINVTDMRSGERTSGIKAVPKGKRTHIAICLALGMSSDEIDEYLSCLGYSPLDESIPEEKLLKEKLEDWEETHHLQRLFKSKSIHEDNGIRLAPAEELQAVNEMLMLRQDMKYEFNREGEGFPYMKE